MVGRLVSVAVVMTAVAVLLLGRLFDDGRLGGARSTTEQGALSQVRLMGQRVELGIHLRSARRARGA